MTTNIPEQCPQLLSQLKALAGYSISSNILSTELTTTEYESDADSACQSADGAHWSTDAADILDNSAIHYIPRRVVIEKNVFNPHSLEFDTVREHVKVFIKVTTTPEFPGANIRNAISGKIHPGMFTGSSSERRFFKVRVSNGDIKSSSKSKSLFFSSFSEYELHFRHKTSTADSVRSTSSSRYGKRPAYCMHRKNGLLVPLASAI